MVDVVVIVAILLELRTWMVRRAQMLRATPMVGMEEKGGVGGSGVINMDKLLGSGCFVGDTGKMGKCVLTTSALTAHSMDTGVTSVPCSPQPHLAHL